MDELKKTMFLFCETGNSVAIQDILKQGVSVNCQDDIGSTPLHIAAAYGRIELVDALVREGAEIDRPNNFGWTPIMQAARNGQSTVAIKLLNNGVNVNLKNKLGANLLALAVASNDEATITAVINDMSHKIVDLSLDPLPLAIASLHGFTNVVTTLLKKGFNPNTATSCTGLTALMMASYNGHYSVAEQLLKNYCDPEITNCINQNALDIAFEMGHEKIQSLLTKKTKVRSNSFANQQPSQVPAVSSVTAIGIPGSYPRPSAGIFRIPRNNTRFSSYNRDSPSTTVLLFCIVTSLQANQVQVSHPKIPVHSLNLGDTPGHLSVASGEGCFTPPHPSPSPTPMSNKCEIDHAQDDTTVLSTSKPVLNLDSFLLKLGLQEYIPIFTKQESIVWKVMEEDVVERGFVMIVKTMYEDNLSCVKMKKGWTEWFHTKIESIGGVSSHLMVMDKVARKLGEERMKAMRFADEGRGSTGIA
ncbi:unnamed protein product [Timema podura]|uniref:Uncharacterized protein n=1 Tax=Timema podura TaxID=61482 RepID=A0ABN7NCQ8_TIMPD|nr:unnamed protein product [Timema podura]